MIRNFISSSFKKSIICAKFPVTFHKNPNSFFTLALENHMLLTSVGYPCKGLYLSRPHLIMTLQAETSVGLKLIGGRNIGRLLTDLFRHASAYKKPQATKTTYFLLLLRRNSSSRDRGATLKVGGEGGGGTEAPQPLPLRGPCYHVPHTSDVFFGIPQIVPTVLYFKMSIQRLQRSQNVSTLLRESVI